MKKKEISQLLLVKPSKLHLEVQVAGKKVTCTGDKAKKTITCSPKKDEVTKGEGLAVTIGDCQLPTGIVLKANSSESFNKLSYINP